MAHNPVAGVEKPSVKRRRKPRILPPETVEAIRRAFIARDRLRDKPVAVACGASKGHVPYDLLHSFVRRFASGGNFSSFAGKNL